MNRELAEIEVGYTKIGNVYRAIIKPKISSYTHIWLLNTESKPDAIDFAKNTAKCLGSTAKYVGLIKRTKGGLLG